MKTDQPPDAAPTSNARVSLPPLLLAPPEAGASRRERRDAAANRAQILTAAQALFAARGVDAVTMEDIAAAAGVGKGTLYRRYPHKGALCVALLGENALRFAASMEQQAASEELAGGAVRLIEAFLAHLVAFNEENMALLSAAGDAALGERRGWLYRTPICRWMRAVLQTLLAHAITQGEVRPVNVTIAADALLAPFAIDLYHYQRHELGLSTADVLRTTRDIVLHGLDLRG